MLLGLVIGVVGGFPPCAVQAESPAAAASAWTTAPLFGADVRSLAFDPVDPNRVFAGTSAGQVYLSTDGGETWADAAAPLPFPGWVVADLEFDPEIPGRLWVALWGIWGGGQVAYSDDGGGWWIRRGDGLEGHGVYTLARVPGTAGHLYAGTSNGVWKSTDGGATWQPKLTAKSQGAAPEKLAEFGRIGKVTSLLVDQAQPQTVIAGTWRRAYRSDDGGETWRGVFEGMVVDSEVFTLTPIAGRPGEIWASTCGWVYRTLDGGGRWQRFKEGFEQRRTPSFNALPGSAERPNGRLLAGTVNGVYVSDNGGDRWRRTSGSDLAVNVIAFHPERPSRVLLGTEGSGVWSSSDGGGSFRRTDRGLKNLRVAALASRPRELLVAVNHAGPASGIYRSLDGGVSFDSNPVSLPTVLDLDVDPTVESNEAWAATEKGLFHRRDGQWSAVSEFGNRRVGGVVAEDGRVVVAAADGVYERWGSGFRRTAYHHGPPRSAVVEREEIWVTDAAGLYRVSAESNHPISAPFAPGKVSRLGSGLLFTGKHGAWRRQGLDAAWEKLTSEPSRALATGDARWPILLMGETSARLLDSAGDIARGIDVTIPHRDVVTALVEGDRLLIGTSGYGLMTLPIGAAIP